MLHSNVCIPDVGSAAIFGTVTDDDLPPSASGGNSLSVRLPLSSRSSTQNKQTTDTIDAAQLPPLSLEPTSFSESSKISHSSVHSLTTSGSVIASSSSSSSTEPAFVTVVASHNNNDECRVYGNNPCSNHHLLQQQQTAEAGSDDVEQRLRLLEDEHDALNTSLISISTQFAQVQFRLKQLSATTSAEEREALLRELEQVAFEGCPDLYGATQELLREEKQRQSSATCLLSCTESKQLPSTNIRDTLSHDVNDDADDDDDDELLTGIHTQRSKSLASARSQPRSSSSSGRAPVLAPEMHTCGSCSTVTDLLLLQKADSDGRLRHGKALLKAAQPSKSGDFDVNSESSTTANPTTTTTTSKEDRRRVEMIQVISKLRGQVEDLESLAYKQGHTDAPPSKLILERQKEVIDELRSRLNINVGEGFEKLSRAELRSRLNAAIGGVIVPIKQKEIMLEQLLHQVKDLERFIEFLQNESSHHPSPPYTHQPTSSFVVKNCGKTSTNTHGEPYQTNRAKNNVQLTTTSETFNLQRKKPNCATTEVSDVMSFGSASPNQQQRNNMWVSTFAAKSHAVLHVLSYMLICGSREQQQQQRHMWFATACNETNTRRDSLPSDCVSSATTIIAPAALKSSSSSTVQRNSSDNARFRSNLLKATPAGRCSHYGDERAVFEIAVAHLKQLVRQCAENLELTTDDDSGLNYYGGRDADYSSGSDEEAMMMLVSDDRRSSSSSGSAALIRCVLREFVPALISLMRHGYAPDRLQRGGAGGVLRSAAAILLPAAALAFVPSMIRLPSLLPSTQQRNCVRGSKTIYSLSALGSATASETLNKRVARADIATGTAAAKLTAKVNGGVVVAAAAAAAEKFHPWHLVLQFYDMNDGAAYNRSTQKTLADAFALTSSTLASSSSCGGERAALTLRETLLVTIGEIIETHSKYKRSLNSYFKAFVCAGLNARMLAAWLRAVYGSDKLIEANYEPWSYAVRTHFSDALASIDELITYQFNLPLDFAVRRLNNLSDAF